MLLGLFIELAVNTTPHKVRGGREREREINDNRVPGRQRGTI